MTLQVDGGVGATAEWGLLICLRGRSVAAFERKMDGWHPDGRDQTVGVDGGVQWKTSTGAHEVTNLWTEAEISALAESAYFPVLRNQLAGHRSVKADYLRKAELELPGRTHHSIKDRCYRISEVLRDNQLPWVSGWNPPGQVGQTPNSLGVTGTITRAILDRARREFGDGRPNP